MTSRAAIPVTAILLFIAVFFYRFNALGGSFGGFDNDHFLQLALAKQVEAGAQPLRDFSDAVSGGWPSLTYEFSALAQRWMGDSFQSEAALTVTGGYNVVAVNLKRHFDLAYEPGVVIDYEDTRHGIYHPPVPSRP